MKDQWRLELAKEYFEEKYETMADIVHIYGDKTPVSAILLNLYEFRKLEQYGYSLEDMFMEVYTSILEFGHVPNLTQYTRQVIERYLRSEICHIEYKEFTDKNIEEISLWLNDLEFRKDENYSFDELIDTSMEEEIDRFVNEEYIEWLLQGSYLTKRENQMLREKLMEGISYKRLREIYGVHQEYIVNRAIRKVRGHARIIGEYNPFHRPVI